MKSFKFFVLAWLVISPGSLSHVNAQDRLVISEFVADNSGTVLDQDGDSSDWIELFNAGTNSVNLAGWHLTDNAAEPTQWTFPATNLDSGCFMVVFASGKNRAVAGAQLHTSFQLDAAGEYLALVKPDGVSIAHEYAPLYPAQVSGVSYGIEVDGLVSPFIANATMARWSVPAGAEGMPLDWTATNFNDSAWALGQTGLGFDVSLTNLPPSGPAVNLASGKSATQSSTRDSFTADLAINTNYGDFTHTLAGANLPATWEVNLGTNYAIESIVLWNRTSNRSRLRDVTVRILSITGATNYTSALLNPENVLGSGIVDQGPATITVNLTQLTGGLVIGGRVRVTRTPDPDLSGSGGAGSVSEADVLALAEVEVFGKPTTGGSTGLFTSLIRTDLASAMTHINASALIRLPFIIPEEELPILDRLTLRMRYDDGFVAFLNGVEIARRNAPATLSWNSAAAAAHADSAAVQFEDLDVTSFIPLLQEGENVLAIHALNVSADDDDLLVDAELSGRTLRNSAPRYYASPSPGATNSGGALGVVADTKFSVDRGFYDQPFTVAVTSATPGAEIRCTTNGSEPSAISGFLYTTPILINRTTALRAIATKPGWLPSDVDTHTYVFLSDVVAQNLASATNRGFPGNWAGSTADYAMDPSVTGPNAAQMTPALRSLPSVFLTASISNLFDATSGIYTHPLDGGVAWERPVSMEMVGTNGQSQFQENCGLRIQGGAFFRSFGFTQKKSLRVLFKSQYGAGKLRHDLFKEQGAAEEFDGLVLRAGANDGYAWADAGTTVQFIRDEFGRRLLLDMGHPSPRGMFVHLYLNGLYWGLYNLVERPNEDFSASYLGGDALAWDACSGGDYKNGGAAAAARWNDFTSRASLVSTYAGYQALQGNNSDGTRNPAFTRYYDKLNYMDYLIANIWGGNWDWPNKNFWFACQPGPDSTGYKFYVWDFENTMGNNRSRSPLTMVSPRPEVAARWVGLPHYSLKRFAEYQLDFADRVQRHFFNGGLLTPQVLTNRYRQLADSVQPAIVAESARWGDDNHFPAYGLNEWLRERDWILTNYLALRSSIVLDQFRGTDNLFPSVNAPLFNQWGGAVPSGFNLAITHTNAGGTIFFTLDGGDPRVPGSGAVSASAQSYRVPITLNAPTQVRARVRNETQWSPLVEAVFYPPQDLSALVLTEIMYHAPNVGATNGDEFDFIELKNSGTNTLNLSGLAFTAGLTFSFTNGTLLAPNQFCVLVANPAAFASKYPGVPIRGFFSGKLDNGGETLRLSHPLGSTVFAVEYDDEPPWPAAAGGLGFSLVPVNPGASPAPDRGAKWRASAAVGGSPGADDPLPGIAPVVINEILAHTDPPQFDTIELYNSGDDPVDISGWYLTDNANTPQKYRIPDGTALSSGGYISFNENQFNAAPGAPGSFALSSTGDDVYLFSATADGQLTGYSHGVAFGASFNGVSFGRRIDSAGVEHFPLLLSFTPGQPNAAPRIGPVVVNEIHYHPAVGGDEFIELLNITASSVPLFDPACPTNTWKVMGLNYTFPTNTSLDANQFLLLVATNPANFRLKYDVPAQVPIFGPVAGLLQNSGERLQLQMPDAPNTNLVPYVTIEEVQYNDQAPWPVAADGGGSSLQRTSPEAYGNEPANWFAAPPTPGRAYVEVDTDGDGMPDAWEIAYGTQWNVPDADIDSDHDGMTNGQEYLAGTNPIDAESRLRLLNVAVDGSGCRLEFLAASNHTYSLLYKSDLSTADWSNLADVPSHRTNRMAVVTDPNPIPAARFYRLVTPAQP